jgi:DNA-binding MarR family transcriptional regulator
MYMETGSLETQAPARALNGTLADQYRGFVVARANCYRAQQKYGLTPVDGFILDLIAIADMDGLAVDLEELSAAAEIDVAAVRRHVVKLISGGWIKVTPDSQGHWLHLTEKTRETLSEWMQKIVEH